MKKVFALIIAGLYLVAGGSMALAGEKAPRKVVDLTQSDLVNLGSDPVKDGDKVIGAITIGVDVDKVE
ncbi:MAG: hypothetical protein JRJ85_19775 [Deltaproteobacteria bacterium]|nr:hypothetical protein [Deltaproteobacteria bacterium]